MPPAPQPSMMSQSAPERSHHQRLDALGRANLVRSQRAALKRDLKAGRARLADVLLAPPDWILTAKAYDMLMQVPKLGERRAMSVLVRCRVSPAKTIGGLTPRQRTELVAHLRESGRS